MPNPSTHRGLLTWGALIAGLIALVLVGYLLTGHRTEAAPAVASAPPPTPVPAAGSQVGAGAGQSAQQPPPQDLLPMTTCWEGLRQFDQTVTLADFRQALGAAIARGDEILTQYLQERLTELVGNDEGRALEVIDWAEQSAHPALGVYLGALKNTEAVHHPKVVDRLLRLGENVKSPLVNRSEAVAALESQTRLDPSSMQRLKTIALDQTVDSLAWTATRTLGRAMTNDYQRTGNLRPYWDNLLDIAQKSEDPAVRILAMEMPSYSNAIIGGDSIDKLGQIMRTAQQRDEREMAAFRLGLTDSPDKALEAYREAFKTEKDLCVRWAILRFTLRAGGPAALPIVKQYADQDPRLAQDYRDFQQLYSDGTVDFARIWSGKKEYHECVDD